MARRRKKIEEQMQLFESGGTPSQTDKADKAFSEMDDMLKKGISEEVKKENGKVISRTYKNPSYAAEDVLRMLRAGEITIEQAEKFLSEQKEAGNYAEGGYEDGGLKDEGGSVDPVSGNDVPSGSTQAEVRDDIPAQLSEGEFVFPADVVRYIGLENLMQLRSKAKQGLAKMEAMGQMGNSEDATMSDDVEFESEIDALIENFDPNDPSTMEFSQGGVVKAANGFFAQPQQSSYGYMPPGFGTQQQVPASGLSYRAPQIPMAQPFVTSAGQRAGSSVGTDTGMQDNIEQRQYIGPNGELITIMFKNGVPQQRIPDGYKVYKPEEEVTPKVTQPEVTSPGSSGDDREREEAEQERMDKERAFNTELGKYANYTPGVGKKYTDALNADPFMTGKFEMPVTALGKSLDTLSTRTDMMEALGKEFGLDMTKYENKVFGFLPGNKYDRGEFMADLEAATYDRQFEGEVYSDKQRQATKDKFGDSYVDVSGIRAGSEEAKASFEAIQRAAEKARAAREAQEAQQESFDRASDLADSLGFEDRSSDNQDYGGGSGDATQSDSASFGGDEGWD